MKLIINDLKNRLSQYLNNENINNDCELVKQHIQAIQVLEDSQEKKCCINCKQIESCTIAISLKGISGFIGDKQDLTKFYCSEFEKKALF